MVGVCGFRWFLGLLSGFGGVWRVFGGCYRAHAAHLPAHEEPATMLLVFERFLQQSWHTMIQPRVLWLAPRVLVPGPPLPHSAHVPMSFVYWVGWLLRLTSVGGCYSELHRYI